MSRKFWLIVVAASLAAGIAHASQYPILDAVAANVVQKYQSATCEQLWEKRGQPASPEQQRAMGLLRSDAQMRQAFFNQIASAVMEKMFECGMIP